MLRKVPAQVALVLVSHSAIALAQEAPVVIAEQPAGVAVAVQKPPSQPQTASALNAGANVPTLQHAPPAIANTGDDFVLHAALTHSELVRAAVLSYRVESEATKEVMFQRSSADDYVAVVPESDLRGETLQYWITLQLVDGSTVAVFDSEKSPHRVQIVPTATDLNEQALLARVGGRRNVFAATGEYVDLGHSEATATSSSGNTQTQSIRDRYYRLEAAYTYRPLRLVSEFTLSVGLVRGNSPVSTQAADAAGNAVANPYDVGLNYVAPTVRFRLADIVYADGTLLTSVTQDGYSTDAGGALLLGDPYGTNLTLGFETIQVFGTRFYTRTDIAVHPRVRITPIIEVTNMPHASNYGVRLLGETTVRVAPGVRIGVRGGYQARKFDSGGASFGALFAYEL